MFYEGQIVKGAVAGHFVIIALRNIDGEAGAQVKPVNPANLQAGPGEMWLPLDKLRPVEQKAPEKNMILTPEQAKAVHNAFVALDSVGAFPHEIVLPAPAGRSLRVYRRTNQSIQVQKLAPNMCDDKSEGYGNTQEFAWAYNLTA